MYILFYCLFLKSLLFSKKDQNFDKDVPFEGVSLGNSTTTFFLRKNDPLRIKYLQLHLPLIVHKILQLNKPIVYITGNTKYIIKPFKSVYMIKKGTKILIGKYDQSKNNNDVFTQSFKGGDFLSYGKKIRWSANVRYVGGINGLKISRIIEGSLGKYDIRVSGSILTNKLLHEHTIEYFTTKNTDEEEVDHQTQNISENDQNKSDSQICMEYEQDFNEFKSRIEGYSEMKRTLQ